MDVSLCASIDALCMRGGEVQQLGSVASSQGSAEFDESAHYDIIYSLVPSKISIVELVREMGPLLTHTDGPVRKRASGMLASLLEKSVDEKFGSNSAASTTTTSSSSSKSSTITLSSPSSSSSSATSPPATTSIVDYFTSKPDSLRAILAFFIERLGDYPSVLPALRAIKVLLRIVEHFPSSYPTGVLAVCRGLFAELHVQASEQAVRRSVYDLLDYMMTARVHALALVGKHYDSITNSGSGGNHNSNSSNGTHGGGGGATAVTTTPATTQLGSSSGHGMSMLMSSGEPYVLEFAVGLIQAMDGEKDPRCLLVALQCVSKILTPGGIAGFGDAVTSLAEELFDVTACYFPITFTPPPNDPHGITREQLQLALRRIFAASSRMAPLVIPLILEKLSSSVLDAKRDALQTLKYVARVYAPDGSLTPFLMDIASAIRKEVIHPRGGAAPEPGSVGAVGVLAPSIWLGSGGINARRIGVSAGAIGMNFSGPTGPTQSLSGYAGLYSLERERSPPIPVTAPVPGTPPPKPAPIIDDALDAIAELTRVLSVSALRASDAGSSSALNTSHHHYNQSTTSNSLPQYWTDFYAMMVRSSMTEIERAAEGSIGRASARILCSMASATPHAFGVIADSMIPVMNEVHADAHSHARHTVHGAILALGAGIVHVVNPSMDVAIASSTATTSGSKQVVVSETTESGGENSNGRGHPLRKHAMTLFHIFMDSLAYFGTSNSNNDNINIASSVSTITTTTTAAAASSDASTDLATLALPNSSSSSSSSSSTSGAARLPPRIPSLAAITEKRCLAIAGLTDLLVRPPSLLISIAHVTTVVETLVNVLLVDIDPLVRIAALRSLCTLGSLRSFTQQIVIQTAIPALVGSVSTDKQKKTASMHRAIHALTQLGSTQTPAVRRVVVPALLGFVVSNSSSGSVCLQADDSSSNSSNTAVSNEAILCAEALARLVSIAGDVGDIATIDSYILHEVFVSKKKAASAGAGDASTADASVSTSSSSAAMPITATQTLPAVLPALFQALFKALTSSPPKFLVPLRLIASTELIARIIATHASAELQDVLRAEVASLLLGTQQSATANNASSLQFVPLDSAKAFALSSISTTSQVILLLPCFAKILACSSRDKKPSTISTSTPDFAALIPSLASVVLSTSLSAGSSSSTCGCEDPWVLRSLQSVRDNGADDTSASAESSGSYTEYGSLDEPGDEVAGMSTSIITTDRNDIINSNIAAQRTRSIILCAQAIGAYLNKAIITTTTTPTTTAQQGGITKAVFDTTTQQILETCRAALKQQPSSSVLLPEYGVLLLVWAAKGLAIRGHLAANVYTSALVDILLLNAENSAIDGTNVATTSQIETSSSAHIALAARGLGLILQEANPGHPFSRECGTTINGLYRQKLFGMVMSRYATLRGSAESTSTTSSSSTASPLPEHPPLMLALCAMASYLPHAALLSEVNRVLPVVIRALEIVSKSSSASSASSSSSTIPKDLRDAVASSALSCLRTLVAQAPATVASHTHSLVPILLRLSVFTTTSSAGPPPPPVRAAAIDCLRGFTAFPYHHLHPVRAQVVKGLAAAVDDPRRSVRRRAAACRNDWSTLNA